MAAAIVEALRSLPGLQVVEAPTLAHGVAAADGAPVAIAVLAIDLRVPPGLAALEALRSAHPEAALVVMSDDGDPALGEAALHQGADAFVGTAGLSAAEVALGVREAVLQARIRALDRDMGALVGGMTRARPRAVEPAPGSPAAVGHDLNNLLQIIINGAEELSESGLPEPQAQSVSAILDAAQRGAVLVRQLFA